MLKFAEVIFSRMCCSIELISRCDYIKDITYSETVYITVRGVDTHIPQGHSRPTWSFLYERMEDLFNFAHVKAFYYALKEAIYDVFKKTKQCFPDDLNPDLNFESTELTTTDGTNERFIKLIITYNAENAKYVPTRSW